MVLIWKEIKNESELELKVDSLFKKWNSVSLKKKGRLLNLWSKQNALTSTKNNVQNVLNDSQLNTTLTVEPIALEFMPDSDQFLEHEIAGEDIPEAATSTKAVQNAIPSVIKPKPAQEQIKTQISIINSDLVGLFNRKANGFITKEQESELKEKKTKKKELEQLLKRKIDNQNRAKKSRESKKIKLAKLCETNPEIQTVLSIRNKPGKPRLEVDQPLLLKAIIDIAVHGSVAHEKRQADIYRSIKTLDDLTQQLKNDGFNISRSGVYIRLPPKRSTSIEGKRHVSTILVNNYNSYVLQSSLTLNCIIIPI